MLHTPWSVELENNNEEKLEFVSGLIQSGGLLCCVTFADFVQSCLPIATPVAIQLQNPDFFVILSILHCFH